MKAKEKAKELVEKFLPYSYCHEMDNSMNRNHQQEVNAKQCALIAVDEILNVDITCSVEWNYWNEVKQEINKL